MKEGKMGFGGIGNLHRTTAQDRLFLKMEYIFLWVIIALCGAGFVAFMALFI
jgi:hypothetical protein